MFREHKTNNQYVKRLVKGTYSINSFFVLFLNENKNEIVLFKMRRVELKHKRL